MLRIFAKYRVKRFEKKTSKLASKEIEKVSIRLQRFGMMIVSESKHTNTWKHILRANCAIRAHSLEQNSDFACQLVKNYLHYHMLVKQEKNKK